MNRSPFARRGFLQESVSAPRRGLIWKDVIWLLKRRKVLLILAVLVLVTLGLTACRDRPTIYVYNWGDYIDEDIIADFEAKTNLRVVYDTYDPYVMV